MSSRAMRKLCNEPDIVLRDEDDNDDDDEEEEIEDEERVQATVDDAVTSKKPKKKKKKKKVVNPFELLNDIDDAQSDNEETAHAESVENQNHTDKSTESLQNGLDTANQTTTEVKSKKKKKKKKKKQKGGASSGQADDEDEIDASIREINEISKTSPPLSTAASSSSFDQGSRTANSKPLLCIEHKHLNPENELRRIFGASVIRNEQRQRGRNRQYQKSTWLVTAKQSWPKMSKTGLSMRYITTEGRYQTFEYEHSKDYQNVQFDFLDAVESMNPANIMAIMNAHPYHIDSLLQLSEVSRINEDMGMSIDLIERALYVFESTFHTLFSLAEGTCQLSYRHAENRGLFIALFRHLTCLGQKGCNRTALEFCKLLLGLEPDKDPLGVLLMMDYYALKTDQNDYLIRMYAEWEAHRNLSQLPNWAFSIAMAYFYSISSSSSSSASSEKPDTSRADSLLQDALLMFPSILLALLEKCSIQPDAAIASHSFFTQTVETHAALTQLVELFIARNYSFWKESESMAWLERNAREVIRRVDAGEPKVKEYAEKREARYYGTPRNIYRHIFLSEHLGVKLKLPPELANTPVMSFDPLPPKDSDIGYSRPDHRLRPVSRGRAGNMFTEFLRSLVPSYVPPPPGEAGADDGEADGEDLGAAGGYLSQNSNLRQGVGAVMEAMRELLQNMEPPPQGPGDNADEEQGGEGGPQLEELD